MLSFHHFLAVSLGAVLGAISRWLLGLWLNGPHVALPWGTLAANLVGGYLIGIVLGVLSLYPDVPLWLRLALVTGFLGGLTTFSTFSGETVGMLARGDYSQALAYAGLSLLGSLALTALGFACVKWLHAGA